MAIARRIETDDDTEVDNIATVPKKVLKKKVAKKVAKQVAKKIVTKVASKPATRMKAPTKKIATPSPAESALLVARVANAIERELTQIELIVGDKNVPPRLRSEAERRARTLASLARTLSVVTQLREKNLQRVNDDDDNPPRDLDELRETLARRLDRLIAEPSQSDDGEPDAD